MLEVGKRYTSPSTGTWVQVVERTPERMQIERVAVPGTGRAGPHFHEDFTQTWEALSGEGRIEVDGEEQEFRTGDQVVLEPNTRHRDPWNPSDAELHMRGTFNPSNQFVEAYSEAWAKQLALGEEGKLNDQDELPLLQILVIAKETDGRSYGASPPVPIQKAALPLMAAAGRLRGFKPSYD